MKKLISSIAIFGVLAACTLLPASAAVGDVAGRYYFTDIVTRLNSVPINAINIGGKTLIDAEAMQNYGFAVTWRPDLWRLVITDNGTHNVTTSAVRQPTKTFGQPGTVAGNYYDTDIVTTLNGKEIKGYNLGGRTFIPAEDMTGYGYTVAWDAAARTLRIGSGAPVTATCRVGSVIYCDSQLYRMVGSGTLSDNCTAKLTIPGSWDCAEDLNVFNYTPSNADYLAGFTLYDLPSSVCLPDGVYAYGTKDMTYSSELAKRVVKDENFTQTSREVLAEHLNDCNMYTGIKNLYEHNYYVRVDDQHVLLVSMMSPSMDGEDARRAALSSLDYSYQAIQQTEPWDNYTYNYGLPNGYTLSGIQIQDASGKLVGLVGKSFYEFGYSSPQQAALDSAKVRFDSASLVSTGTNGSEILKCVTLKGHGLYGMSDMGTAPEDMTVSTVAVFDKAHTVVVLIALSADDVPADVVNAVAQNASIS